MHRWFKNRYGNFEIISLIALESSSLNAAVIKFNSAIGNIQEDVKL